MADGNHVSPMEKDFGNHEHLDGSMDGDAALTKIRTAGSISISPELFERLYLQPKVGASPESGVRKAVGIPTPLALIGFLMSLTPLSNDLMGWRGAGQANGAASIGVYFFFGGLLMILGSVGEWIVGSTFPCVVFGTFGAFWLNWGATLQPFYGIRDIYATVANEPTAMGEAVPPFLNAYGFVFLWMGIVCFIFMICSLRTNITFFIIFITLVLAFGLLAGAFWQNANGNMAVGMACVTAAGAFAFVTCVAGWWIFASILLASVDFPIVLPVGDLSAHIKGRSEKSKV